MLDINILKVTKAEFEQSLQIQKKLEKAGLFNQDEIENTYENCEPVDESFDYLKRGLRNKIKHWIYMTALKKYGKKINRELTNLKVVGRENLVGLKGGRIITCNHISKVDSFAVRAAVGYEFKFVAADFNNWKGIMGDLSRNTGYLPLPAKMNLTLMRKFNQSIAYFLERKWPILFYPEQALWCEYKKPRPLKRGAFFYAAKHRCPVVPLFITMQDKAERFDAQGRANYGDYTIHILPPIYPRADLDERANVDYLMDANFNAWRECYEKVYGKPLAYETKMSADLDPVVQKYVQAVRPKTKK